MVLGFSCVLGRAPTSWSEAGQGPGEPKVGTDPIRYSQLGAEPWPLPSQGVQGLTGGLMGEWLESGLVVLGGSRELGVVVYRSPVGPRRFWVSWLALGCFRGPCW